MSIIQSIMLPCGDKELPGIFVTYGTIARYFKAFLGGNMDSGSYADWFSAIGTIAAVILSLCLALGRKKVKVNFDTKITLCNESTIRRFGIKIELNGFNHGMSSDAIKSITLRLHDKNQSEIHKEISEQEIIEIKSESYVKGNIELRTPCGALAGYVIGDLREITVLIHTFRGTTYKKVVQVKAKDSDYNAKPEQYGGSEEYFVVSIFGKKLTLSDIQNEKAAEIIAASIQKEYPSMVEYQIENNHTSFSQEDAKLLADTYMDELREQY